MQSGSMGSVGAFGAILGFAGALLDFYSGYLLLAGSNMRTTEMGMVTQGGGPGVAWGIGISALGIVLAATAVASILRLGAGRMADFGALMVVYGIVMLFIGASMYAGVTSMTQGAPFPALGMLVVGALMVANGAAMRRPRMM